MDITPAAEVVKRKKGKLSSVSVERRAKNFDFVG